ncbi:hypothetical protein [Nioella aestuarii]|uniref:hypothetical protein n=1 Tax=Nioella aestuarii TaxID=1662864 RepID=UPI003D7F9BDB
MDIFPLILPFATLVSFYAILTSLSWLRRFIGERMAARRKGMILNLTRRAVPPIIAGLILLIAGGALGLVDYIPLAILLIAGGVAFGVHKGLSDLHSQNWRELALRGAITLALTLFTLWQLGVI